jgi:hypothetical protein
MARAPETGFYFEPIAERLALVLEDSPFPSDDAWAWVGDPVAMPPEVARLEVAMRWPGVDPESLQVELELGQPPAATQVEADLEEATVGGAIARAHATSRES